MTTVKTEYLLYLNLWSPGPDCRTPEPFCSSRWRNIPSRRLSQRPAAGCRLQTRGQLMPHRVAGAPPAHSLPPPRVQLLPGAHEGGQLVRGPVRGLRQLRAGLLLRHAAAGELRSVDEEQQSGRGNEEERQCEPRPHAGHVSTLTSLYTTLH